MGSYRLPSLPLDYFPRTTLIDDIKSKIEATVDMGMLPLTILYGIRGAGKKTLAAYFACHYERSGYYVAYFKDIKSRDDLIIQYYDIACLANINIKDDAENSNIQAIINYFNKSSKTRCLFLKTLRKLYMRGFKICSLERMGKF